MAWNEPGNNGKDDDPWGGGKRGGDQGPPDLDEVIKNLSKKFGGIFGGSGGGSSQGNGSSGAPAMSGGLLVGIVVVAVIAWAVMGVYQIGEAERGIVLRFGKVLEREVQPGLRWNPPLIDVVTKVNTQELKTRPYESDMLTADENIVNLSLAIQYRIQDPKKYVLAVQDPERSLDNATESVIRHVVGGNLMNEILTTGRNLVARDVNDRLQDYMDVYNTGIIISRVNVVDAKPPDAVRPAFDDVIKAREDEQRAQNQAQQYSNRIIPEARGEAQRAIEQANAYKQEAIAKAMGDASRFEQLLTEYSKAPEVTRQRLYIEAMQQVFSNSSKVMVDVEGGNNMLYIPLDKIMEQQNNATSRNLSNRQDLRALANELAPYLPDISTNNAADRSRLGPSSSRGNR